MTDNEIIKALEWHLNDETHCSACPFEEHSVTHYCVDMVIKDALDLIKRQQAEKETMQSYIDCLKAEIERLEKTVEDMTEGCQIAIKVSENEAIRRFSYRLRAECGSYDTGHYIFHEDEIHNLEKEMVGEMDV